MMNMFLGVQFFIQILSSQFGSYNSFLYPNMKKKRPQHDFPNSHLQSAPYLLPLVGVGGICEGVQNLHWGLFFIDLGHESALNEKNNCFRPILQNCTKEN